MNRKTTVPFADPAVRNEWQGTGKAGPKQRAKMDKQRRPPLAPRPSAALACTPEDLAQDLQWRARGGNDREPLTEEFVAMTFTAMLCCHVRMTEQEESALVAAMGYRWKTTSNGQRLLEKRP